MLHQENSQTGKRKKRGMPVPQCPHGLYKLHHYIIPVITILTAGLKYMSHRSADRETVIKVSFALNHVL